MGLSKIKNCFSILTFLGGILSLRQVCFFLKEHKILNLLIPYMTYFTKKGSFFRHKNRKKIEMPQNKKILS
jgi:hypothetical protein